MQEESTSFVLLPLARGGDGMVTYSDVFQFCILIVSLISLIFQITKKK
jgi:hypothetical protein